ncbi:MAG: hypothetical protein ACT4PT_13900, partial [Methanobacteriota archaeon]
ARSRRVPVDPRRRFEGVRYVGKVRARRVVYQVYDADRRFLLVWPSRRSPNSFFLSEVPRAFVDAVRRRFRGSVTTSVAVRQRLGGPAFRQLGALLVLAARGEAKVRPSKAGPLAFRVYA